MVESTDIKSGSEREQVRKMTQPYRGESVVDEQNIARSASAHHVTATVNLLVKLIEFGVAGSSIAAEQGGRDVSCGE